MRERVIFPKVQDKGIGRLRWDAHRIRTVGRERAVPSSGWATWAGTARAEGERKTMAVGNAHDFGAFATFGFPEAAPLFLPERRFRR